ncbi:MAG: hypothetical protein HYY48_10125 [Gammaproteobacteria bacterium]|nr:hypothetical protein [Gammaproteobacteria bacterium]
MQVPIPVRIFSCKRQGPDGEPCAVPATPELLEEARRYALGWKELFGRFPQGQHPLKFPVNRQITLAQADLILEFPASRVDFP